VNTRVHIFEGNAPDAAYNLEQFIALEVEDIVSIHYSTTEIVGYAMHFILLLYLPKIVQTQRKEVVCSD
jgi:hypothetical protein